jgi:DNA-directed RNA polymerase specialized sigma24 family protein
MSMALSDNHGGHCPMCNQPVDDGAVCPRCGNLGEDDATKHGDPHSKAVVDTMRCFILSDADAEPIIARIISDIERHLPGFLKRTALEALLPLVQQRAQGFYRANGVGCDDASELASELIAKICKAISKEWPRGNIGCWITTIRARLLLDYWDKKRVQEKWFGKRKDMAVLADVSGSDDRSLELFLSDFDARERELVEALLAGDKWKEIEARYSEQAAALRATLLSLEWDGQSAPLRKKRRRRARPDQ